jgi:Tfp pilus assembly protein PilE
MGTQQILLIVLSVIIVGAAVAVGIQMFQSQAVNSARSAIMSDMNNMAAMLVAYFKTPVALGGAGFDPDNATKAAMDAYLGAKVISNDNADYTLTAADGTTHIVTITAVPKDTALKAIANPKITVDLDDGTIVATPNNAPAAG